MDKWVEEDLIPIRERVFAYLKNAILEGEYQAGERLVEREIAEKLNISRTPIREALLRLESLGFVKTLPRKGVIVSKITYEDVLEVFTILTSLEVLAVKLAAQKMDAVTAKELDQMIEHINEVLAGNVDTELSIFHIEHNDALYKAAKSPKLYEMLTGLLDYIRAFANIGHELPGRMRESLSEHRDILIAVRNKEVEMAELKTRIHLENSKKAYMEMIEKNKKQSKKGNK